MDAVTEKNNFLHLTVGIMLLLFAGVFYLVILLVSLIGVSINQSQSAESA